MLWHNGKFIGRSKELRQLGNYRSLTSTLCYPSPILRQMCVDVGGCFIFCIHKLSNEVIVR